MPKLWVVNMRHLDPTTTKVYTEHTVWYGFDTGSYCFKCKVRKGYLTGRRADLPEEFNWAIGQHIDTVSDFVTNIMALRIC